MNNGEEGERKREKSKDKHKLKNSIYTLHDHINLRKNKRKSCKKYELMLLSYLYYVRVSIYLIIY